MKSIDRTYDIDFTRKGDVISVTLFYPSSSSDPIASIKLHDEEFESLFPLAQGATKIIDDIEGHSSIWFHLGENAIKITMQAEFMEGTSSVIPEKLGIMFFLNELRDEHRKLFASDVD